MHGLHGHHDPSLLTLSQLEDAPGAHVRPGLDLDGGVLAGVAQLLDANVKLELSSQFRPPENNQIYVVFPFLLASIIFKYGYEIWENKEGKEKYDV